MAQDRLRLVDEREPARVWRVDADEQREASACVDGERHVRGHRHEPLCALVGTVATSTGEEVPYAAFIAPALLAVSAMNGAVFDSTWNVFFKMNYSKLYEMRLSH